MLWPKTEDRNSDAIAQGPTSPLSSRGFCKPTDEYPYCTEGALQLRLESTVNGDASLVASC